jgi:hypothetical protein
MCYQAIISDIIKKDPSFFKSRSQDLSTLALVLAERRRSTDHQGGLDVLKSLRESSASGAAAQGKLALEKKAIKLGDNPFSQVASGSSRANAILRGAILGSGNQATEVNLVPNKILMLGPNGSHSAS